MTVFTCGCRNGNLNSFRIVFVSYVYTEPLLLAILDFIPGVYFLSLALKMKLLSTNNGWHQNLYDMTFGHLQEIDIFHIAWHYSSDKLVLLLVKLLHLLDRLYPKLSDDQLDLLADSLEAASERVREAKTAHEEKENFRKSKLMQRSAMEQVKAEKKANLVESQVFESG